MKVMKNNSIFSMWFILNEMKNQPFSPAYMISCTCNHRPVFFCHQLEWLCTLSTSASGWQNNLYPGIQFSHSGIWSVPNKGELQDGV
jgi:hypothetical protein